MVVGSGSCPAPKGSSSCPAAIGSTPSVSPAPAPTRSPASRSRPGSTGSSGRVSGTVAGPTAASPLASASASDLGVGQLEPDLRPALRRGGGSGTPVVRGQDPRHGGEPDAVTFDVGLDAAEQGEHVDVAFLRDPDAVVAHRDAPAV